jgi:hypothetical protein
MKQWIRWGVIVVCLGLIVIRQLYPNLLNIIQSLQVDAFSVSLVVIAALALLFPFFQSFPSSLRKIQKRWIIITICLILIALRVIFPIVQVDTNSIWLVGIVALLFVLPDLKSLTPYIKRVKFGDVELELKETIANLGREVEKAENAVAEEADSTVSKEVSSEIEKVLQESSKDPRATLLLLSSKIEGQLRLRLEEAGIAWPYKTIRSVELGMQKGIFPQEFLPAFRDFWAVRNQVAHGAAFDVDDAYILSLVSLGTQLLKIASSVKKQDGKEQPTQ